MPALVLGVDVRMGSSCWVKRLSMCMLWYGTLGLPEQVNVVPVTSYIWCIA